MKKNIAVFASGAGSNFININNKIKNNKINAKICLLVSNNSPSKELKLGGIKSLIPQITITVKAIKPIKKPLFLYAGIPYTNIFS